MVDVSMDEASRRERAALLRGLERRVTALVAAVGAGASFEAQRVALLAFLGGEVLPHVEAADRALSRVSLAPPAGTAPAGAARPDRCRLASLTERLAAETDGVALAAAAQWTATLLAGHIAKENALLPVVGAVAARPEATAVAADRRMPARGAVGGGTALHGRRRTHGRVHHPEQEGMAS